MFMNSTERIIYATHRHMIVLYMYVYDAILTGAFWALLIVKKSYVEPRTSGIVML